MTSDPTPHKTHSISIAFRHRHEKTQIFYISLQNFSTGKVQKDLRRTPLFKLPKPPKQHSQTKPNPELIPNRITEISKQLQ